MRQQQQFGQQRKAIIFLILFAARRDANGVEQTQLNVQQSASASQNNDQNCRPCACISVPPAPAPLTSVPVPPPQMVMPQAQLLQCPPMPACPMAMPMPLPMRPPRPPPPAAFICPPPAQCPPPPVCPRPEPCPAPIPARQAPPPLPSLPALPAFIALPPQPPQAGLRPAGIPLIGTQNDCCCNCVQTTCRATGIAGRAHGARTASFGSAIWEELFGGGEAPPPPPKLFAVEPKCNSRVLESAILENMFTDLESSKRRIQAAAEQAMGAPVNVVCGASEFSFVVHTDQFCQANGNGISCYAFSSSAAAVPPPK